MLFDSDLKSAKQKLHLPPVPNAPLRFHAAAQVYAVGTHLPNRVGNIVWANAAGQKKWNPYPVFQGKCRGPVPQLAGAPHPLEALARVY